MKWEYMTVIGPSVEQFIEEEYVDDKATVPIDIVALPQISDTDVLNIVNTATKTVDEENTVVFAADVNQDQAYQLQDSPPVTHLYASPDHARSWSSISEALNESKQVGKILPVLINPTDTDSAIQQINSHGGRLIEDKEFNVLVAHIPETRVESLAETQAVNSISLNSEVEDFDMSDFVSIFSQ